LKEKVFKTNHQTTGGRTMLNGFSITTTAEPEVARPGINVLTAIFGLMLLVGVGAGCYAFIAGHEHVYNNTREMPWGILISTYAFFAITSTGLCLLAAISHVFGGNKLAPLANRLVWGSIITIMSAFAVIGFEIENPHRMLLYNVISPNITSNIWWMGTLYGLAVAFMLVEFWMILTKQYKMAVILGVCGALAEVAANTCLGGVFATLPSRPFWYGGMLPVYFLSCAFLSGAAMAILFNHYAVVIRRREMTEAEFNGIRTAGKVLLLMLILVSVGTFWRMVSFYVGGTNIGRDAADALLFGPLSNNFKVFEVTIGLVLPIVILAITRLKSVPAMSAAALMAIVGMFFARYDMVVAGQIVPQFLGYNDLPKFLEYTPSLGEILVTLGGIGLTGTAFLLGERFFGKAFTDHGEHH
jgi:molybdopterin-containing oxidoreductase family membrane subunit